MFRIGVNLGDVVVEGDDLLGDGVNVAARLEQLCEPAACWSRAPPTTTSRASSACPWSSPASSRSRTSRGRCGRTGCALDGRPGASPAGQSGGGLAALAASAVIVLAGAPGMVVCALARGQPSIAVLPLENRSGDARLGRLADGMIENVIGDLTGLGWDVMARGTTSPTATRRATRAGSARARRRLRGRGQPGGRRQPAVATVALVDAETGRQIWSERYDRLLEDLFAVQDELSLRIATSLGLLARSAACPAQAAGEL